MMELSICEGDYGLPSLDSDCLHLMLLAKVAKVPLNVTSRQVKYPIFVHDTKTMKDFTEVQSHLYKLGYSPDFTLNARQVSQAYVLVNMLKYYLTPVMKYVWWLNEYNYENFSSKWLMSSTKFPFNITGLSKKKNEAKTILELRYPNESYENAKLYLLEDFKDCFPLFAQRLKKSPYFYGNTISSVDIVLYGFIAPLLKIPFPENEFKEVIESFPVFTSFVTRINCTYFPEVEYTEKYIKTSMFEDDEKNHENVVFFFGFMVTTAMVGLTFFKYIFKKHHSFNK